MADKHSESHKRSRSGLALSLLHRDKSKTDDNSEERLSLEDGTNSSVTSPSVANGQTTRQSFTLRSTSRRKGGSIAETSPSASNDGNLEATISNETQDGSRQVGNVDNANGGGDLSIEQSVRTFRLFETLRSGDTNAILKAIKESQDQHGVGVAASGTTILHLAIQCADPQVVEYVMSNSTPHEINARDREGNTPLHLAAQLGRDSIVRQLLERPNIDDSIPNYRGQTALELARTPEIFQQLQLAKSLFIDSKTKEIQELATNGGYEKLEKLLEEPRVEGTLDVNSLELATDPATVQSGGTLLHEGARKKDTRLIQILLMHGADPFRRDKKGRLPQDVTKDDKTRAIVKKSPAAVIAQRGIQERAILGNAASQASLGRPGNVESTLAGKEAREMRGYLKKWTNYTSGFKLRWFVLEDGVLSYYKHQDDAGSACRGAISMRIAKLHMDSQDKTRFEILGKSSVKYHLKANHVVEAKRWFWALNNAIQYAKDEAKEEERRKIKDAEDVRQARAEQTDFRLTEQNTRTSAPSSLKGSERGLAPPAVLTKSGNFTKLGTQTPRTPLESVPGDEDGSVYNSYDPSLAPIEMNQVVSHVTSGLEAEGEYDEFGDFDSSRDVQPANKDAFNITAQSAKLQLDLLASVAASLRVKKSQNPDLAIADSTIDGALNAYESAVSSLSGLLADLMKISRDRDAYWQYRLDREADTRRMWEESMARIVQEHEELQNKIGESEDKRKRTKKALKEVLEGTSAVNSHQPSRKLSHEQLNEAVEALENGADVTAPQSNDGNDSVLTSSQAKEVSETLDSTGDPRRPSSRKQSMPQFSELAESDSDDDEFFDAIDAGEIVVEDLALAEPTPEILSKVEAKESDLRVVKHEEIVQSFEGYTDPPRQRLKMENDNRPKISLWGILKSMIGKDMTKMTLPVSFNEPTSLLQRVAEDMEYTDLLDTAADRADSMERMLYVAAFAASEYASTIGRVAKPFNPLLGETFEYVRPDKGYRFFIEQVSHHPPIGAAWAESAKWDYYGESAVKSKFYGKSFDINPLGTWFLKLRPVTGGEELYTWKKVTSSVVGIITGNPTVDNYGPMEIKNWSTGEICSLDFKARGWKASSAYQVSGKIVDKKGVTRWSIGGRWNDKLFARQTSGLDVSLSENDSESTKTFMIWQANPRPTGIPFNLTPFVVTLNAIPDSLRPYLPPTDTRLRPDQRAMEDGEYDFAATEKHRVEEKQRAKRRERERRGEEFSPKWFSKAKCPTTGEEYWVTNGLYWKCRQEKDWVACEDIF